MKDKHSKGGGGPVPPVTIRPRKGAIRAAGQPSNNDLKGSEKNGPQDIK
jgi:hypothetical protein